MSLTDEYRALRADLSATREALAKHAGVHEGIDKQFDAIDARFEKTEKSLWGNGQPGVVQDVRDMKIARKIEAESRRPVRRVILGVLQVLIAAFLIFLASEFWKSRASGDESPQINSERKER